jgi:hypothetical protein
MSPTFGDTSAGAGSAAGSSDRSWMDKAVLIEDAEVTSIWIYIATQTASEGIKGLIYGDDGAGNNPAARLIVSAAGLTSAVGWLQLAASGNLVAGTYWIGTVHDGFSHSVGSDTGLSGVRRVIANGTLSYATPPATWPGSDVTYTDVRNNVYVEYTAGGKGVGRPDFRRFPKAFMRRKP